MEDVSAFIVGTCRLHPKMHSDAFDLMEFPLLNPDHMPEQEIVSGSSVEFYIDPINQCIDDMDVMRCMTDALAFTEDYPVLPDNIRGFLDTIVCYKILPYPDHPGFVQLQRSGNFRYNWHKNKFEFQEAKNLKYVMSLRKPEYVYCDMFLRESGTGSPATKFTFEYNTSEKLHCALSDSVPCLWCPTWPKEAENWPFRQRNYGWPTTANIHKIVESGCHVVFAKHPACRSDENQWRLSFSVAEVILLQSWTPVQQIVYHMLRFFAKKELIKKDCQKDDEVLCTYHFKTLMMWSCEEMSPEWWISLSVIEVCSYMLRKLSKSLGKRFCPNYFIPQANLFHERMNQKVAAVTLRHLIEFCNCNILSDWFMVKYIKPVLERLFTVDYTPVIVMDLGQCLMRVCEIMDAGKLKSFDWHLSVGFLYCVVHTFRSVTVERGYRFRGCLNYVFWLRKQIHIFTDLTTAEYSSNCPQFVKVLFILHTANDLRFQKTTYHSEIFTEFIREISWQPKVVRSKHHNFPKPSKANLDRSGVLFLKALDLMENLTVLSSPQEFKLVSQLSKELLRNALYCADLNSNAIRNVALMYMAALHFSESDYETAIEICTTVVINQTPDDDYDDEEELEEKKMETMNAGCLLYIEDVIRIVGFYLLFRNIRVNSKYSRRWHLLDLRVTPEVFAQYVIISSEERTQVASELNYTVRTPAFPVDEILMTITNRKPFLISKKTDSVLLVYQRTDPLYKFRAFKYGSDPNEDTIQLLMEYSLENLASFYNAICKDFSIYYDVADCYRAAYLYRCHNYSEVFNLCERILGEPDLRNELEQFPFANVMVLPPLESYFDRDVQCSLGLHTLVYYLSPLNEDLRKLDTNPILMFQEYFARGIYSDKGLLADALLYDYQVNSHYFVGRHFLARYLKVRCLLRCYNSNSEIIFEYKKLKSSLPFERIIHCLLRQEIQQI